MGCCGQDTSPMGRVGGDSRGHWAWALGSAVSSRVRWVSSDIMLRCLPVTPKPDPLAPPMLFTNICRAWSNIALSTPSLWATMRIKTAMSEDFRNLMDLWAARARTRSLNLSLYGSIYRMTPSLRMFLGRYLWNRVDPLKLYLPSGDQLGQLQGPFPNLHALTIGKCKSEDGWHDPEYYSRDASDCVEMLSAAFNLVECTLDGVYFESAFEPAHSRVVIHPNIKHLYLGGYHWETDISSSSAYILQYLTLPSLERLTISNCNIEFEDLLTFFRRSSPPLQSLCMVVPSAYFRGEYSPSKEFLRLIPGITDLHLTFYGIGNSPASLRAVCSPLLPDLRSLTIRVGRPQYEDVLSALSAWRTASHSPKKSFKLMWRHEQHPTVSLKPSPDVITAFRQLMEDGMQIHVGTQKRNFI
ncbi:hypothetical protein B0H11DRAFT_1207541 [Mycena galericulata]|nr:hypothetical protein B0H11DRAFT_1207541 [Mycena galericulata]